MLSLGPLAFAQPWLLLALILLPLIWLLLRVTPPTPRLLRFPAVRLLFGLKPPEETPARTPWWLILLRLAVAGLVILGLAQPLLNPIERLSGDGPLVIAVDDGWASARNWPVHRQALNGLLEQAERNDRNVVLLTTAPGQRAPAPLAALPAGEARELAATIQPKPWPVARAAAAARLDTLPSGGSVETVWLSDGLDQGDAADFAEALSRLGPLTVFAEEAPLLSHLLLLPESEGSLLTARARRAAAGAEEAATVTAIGEDGALLARVPLLFAEGASETTAELELPAELRNRIARLSIEGERSAGAVVLLDERWRRRPVGLVTQGVEEKAQPLLSELYYLRRALEPLSELREGSVEELLARELAVLILPDRGALAESEVARIRDWVEGGGLLLRFAGPRLAEAGEVGQQLLPVRLRAGGRVLGGALTWDTPVTLARFEASSPFAGLVPPREVLINRQVLAEPALDLGEKTWARLSDGTPLMTASKLGEGRLVLLHTTANTDWSNLPLSGLFVQMLQRLVAVSQGLSGAASEFAALPPIETLNGFGQLGEPPTGALALESEAAANGVVGPRNPPGYYGDPATKRAHNIATGEPSLAPLGTLPGAELRRYATGVELDLKPWLLSAALILLLVDLLVALALAGLLRGLVPGTAALALLVALALPAGAQSPEADARALEATSETHLAYVVTGVAAVDEISEAGLEGLSRALRQRTSIEPGRPLPVNLERDELAFFPLLYWPIAQEQRLLSAEAVRKVNEFLNQGGTILFDLRDPTGGVSLLGRPSEANQALQRLVEGIEIPRLVPLPPEHVLTKSFYLMQEFPGRFSGGALWLEDSAETVNDGVASIVIGSNDWAGAWAIDESGRPLLAVVPGGERQRELAYRFGINLAMYALTGNYKADQVHVPFILERLGQ
ncbi:MAG: DUF4159 domain-containing protein [Kiloniellales bacterium]